MMEIEQRQCTCLVVVADAEAVSNKKITIIIIGGSQ
jgi:hypothetical protein